MVVIRLSRVGKKNNPSYRVVVADKQRAAKRKFIEVIGHYNPTLKPKELVIDKDRAVFWMSRGAQASDTVRNLMADLGILKKSDKVNKKYAKPHKKNASPEDDKKPEVENSADVVDESTSDDKISEDNIETEKVAEPEENKEESKEIEKPAESQEPEPETAK